MNVYNIVGWIIICLFFLILYLGVVITFGFKKGMLCIVMSLGFASIISLAIHLIEM